MTTPLQGRPVRRPVHDPTLLRAHARWVLLVALVTALSACLLPLLIQGPQYRSEAEVLVGAVAGTPTVGAIAPVMETEVQIVASAAVLTAVVEETGTSLRRLERNLSVTVPPESAVLLVRYSDAGPARAQRRAQAIVDAYVDFRGGSATVLSPATRPRSASSPDLLLNGSAGLVLGLMLGVGSALVRDRLDDRVRGPRDVELRTGLPVLAAVPAVDGGHDPSAPDAGGAEAFRVLRAKVERVLGAGGTPLVVVAGAEFDDEARPTAEGLAIALARTGTRVVLVDADVRAGPGDGVSADAGPGLADLLRGHVDLAGALRDGPVPGLRLLGTGGAPAGVEDLLAGPPAVEVLQRLRAEGEHVVVHAAPVLGAAETVVLGARADLVLLSAVVGVTTRGELTAAASEVRGVGGAAQACVLHDAAGAERGPSAPPTAEDPPEEPPAVHTGRPPASPQLLERSGPPLPDGGRATAGVVDRR